MPNLKTEEISLMLVGVPKRDIYKENSKQRVRILEENRSVGQTKKFWFGALNTCNQFCILDFLLFLLFCLVVQVVCGQRKWRRLDYVPSPKFTSTLRSNRLFSEDGKQHSWGNHFKKLRSVFTGQCCCQAPYRIKISSKQKSAVKEGRAQLQWGVWSKGQGF